jgi:hypothetical protein
MTFGQFQLPMWHTLDNKTTQIWWLTKMEYKYLKLLVIVLLLLLLTFDVFVTTSAHTLLFWLKWFVQIYSNVNRLLLIFFGFSRLNWVL